MTFWGFSSMAAEVQVVRFNPEDMFPDIPLGLLPVAAFLSKARHIHPLSTADINRASFGHGYDEAGVLGHLEAYDFSNDARYLPPSAAFLAVCEEVCDKGTRYTYLPVSIGSVLPMNYAMGFECATSCAQQCPELEEMIEFREHTERQLNEQNCSMPHEVRPVIKLAAHDLMREQLIPYKPERFPLYALTDAYTAVACVLIEHGLPSLYPFYFNLGTQRINARHKETGQAMTILSPLHAFAERGQKGIKSNVMHGWVEGYECGAAGTREQYEAFRDHGHSIADEPNGKFAPIPRSIYNVFKNLS